LTLSEIHGRIATSVILFALIAGVWGIIQRIRGQGITGNYWGILAVGELLFIGQAILGVLLWVNGERPGRLEIHILYGVALAVALPGYYAISKGREDKIASLMYGLICLLVAALGVRAMITGI
jgi:hypothetical protein